MLFLAKLADVFWGGREDAFASAKAATLDKRGRSGCKRIGFEELLRKADGGGAGGLGCASWFTMANDGEGIKSGYYDMLIRAGGNDNGPGEALYANPRLYSCAFPVEAADVDFFSRAVKAVPPGPIVDLGCGTGELTELLAGRCKRTVHGVDLCRTLLAARRGSTALFLAADIARLPLRCATVAAFVSRLFGVAYAAGAGADAAGLFRQFYSLLVCRGALALELPVAWAPERMAGLAERADIGGGWQYEFQYLDPDHDTALGVTYHTRIRMCYGGSGRILENRDRLFVFNGGELMSLLREIGFCDVAFCPAYDWKLRAEKPPSDCLRAVVLARKE